MITEKHIIEMMIEALPRCPICGSNIGYEVVSVFKGTVKCKACQTEWSSRDFFVSERLENLTIKELPEGHRAFTRGKHVLRKHEEYPVDFLRSLGKIGGWPISRGYQEFIWVSFMGFLVFLVAFIPRFLLIDKTSVMTDEPLYVNAGRLYVQSFFRLNFSSEVWRVNAEHPPIAKLLIGASSYIFAPLLGWESTCNLYFSARLAPVTAGTLICVFIYLIGRRYYGDEASLLAAILAALSPWLIYYSTLAILDIFAALFLSLAFLLLPLIKGINRHLILVGVLSGLAVGSKGTAIAAFPGIGLYLLLKTLVGKSRTEEKSLRMILLQFLLISLTAASTFFATWPWLWQKTPERIIWVFGFHLGHMESGHMTFYAGRVYAHVPQWVTIYILFIKTPILLFILG
ncbi:glycosyltransferase family 39 protein, partial [Candidatus Bathyarchaeota archaeon]|nr:glycosyltransferase family 39 protein [Candidatus Bathyarchaeota archaeon]